MAASSTQVLIGTLRDQGGTSLSVLQCLTQTGTSRWQWGAQDVVCTDLSWNAESNSWLGVLTNPERTSQDRLVRWSLAGDMTTVGKIGSTQASAFVLAGGSLLLSDSTVIDTASGTRTGNLR